MEYLPVTSMDEFGARLRTAREARSLSLKEVAERTKISVTSLEALERSDFTRVPGGIYGRAFVRLYATELEMDADATVTEFVTLLERHEREAAERGAVRPEITADDKLFLARQQRALRVLRVVIVVVAVIAVSLLIWQIRVFMRPAPAGAAAPVATTSGPPAGQPAASAPSAPIPAPVTAPAAVSGRAAASMGRLIVDVRASDDAWVVIDADGKRVLTDLIRPGTQQRIEAEREIVLDVGNAGAIVWSINGTPAKSLGATGAHVRVRLTGENAASFVP
jgi:cytoskeletal protein RodZ